MCACACVCVCVRARARAREMFCTDTARHPNHGEPCSIDGAGRAYNVPPTFCPRAPSHQQPATSRARARAAPHFPQRTH
ncbi:hypothetical protein EON67_03725 [archaeon]|nr:MAG: hypothetical protein EON67_03725 [archaeon]